MYHSQVRTLNDIIAQMIKGLKTFPNDWYLENALYQLYGIRDDFIYFNKEFDPLPDGLVLKEDYCEILREIIKKEDERRSWNNERWKLGYV